EDPSVREDLAASHLRVATILNEIGNKADAVAAMEVARGIQKKLVDDNPTVPEYRQGLTDIDNNLGWMRHGGRLQLLGSKSVQEELKLTGEQKKQIGRLMEKWREVFLHGPRGMGHDDPKGNVGELTAAENTLIEDLRPEQAARLKQIAWQHAG